MARKTPERTMRWFFESAPLYLATRVKLAKQYKREDVPIPTSITRRCHTHKRDTTWRLHLSMRPTQDVPDLQQPEIPIWQVRSSFVGGMLVQYGCADCQEEQEGFWVTWEAADPTHVREGATLTNSGPYPGQLVALSDVYKVRKIGQSSAPLPQSPPALAVLLGDDHEHYRRALQCMSMGFGVGAVAYLRRVIESKTAALIARLEELLVAEKNTEALEQLRKAQGSFSASERLEHAAKLLPGSLRLGPHNPLDVLYGALSHELHASVNEDEANATAERLQWALDFLVTRIDDDLRQIRHFNTTIAQETSRKPKA